MENIVSYVSVSVVFFILGMFINKNSKGSQEKPFSLREDINREFEKQLRTLNTV